MEWEGKVSLATHRCAATGEAIPPGDWCWSALVLDGGAFVRRDHSANGWATADRSAILSWWKVKVPEPSKVRPKLRLDAAVLRRIFTDLKDAPARPQRCFAYVVALCLVRIRAFRILDISRTDAAAIILFEDRSGKVAHRLPDPGMTPEEEAAMHENLLNVVAVG